MVNIEEILQALLNTCSISDQAKEHLLDLLSSNNDGKKYEVTMTPLPTEDYFELDISANQASELLNNNYIITYNGEPIISQIEYSPAFIIHGTGYSFVGDYAINPNEKLIIYEGVPK